MIDFPRINAAVLSQFSSLLDSWLPGGRVEGNEYVTADLAGGPGRSLSVNTSTGVWKDFARDVGGKDPVSLFAAIHGMKQGEAARELAQKLGIEADTGNGKSAHREGKARITATYDYHDAAGNLVFQVCRMEPKSFRQRRPDGAGGWTWSVKDVEMVPYRLPDLLQADEVFIVEGEKDADRLMSLGLVATTNAQGAGKWRSEYAQHFQDKRVVILADNDDPGRKHAAQVARSLQGKAKEVRVVDLPGLPDKGDVSDFLDAGGTVEQLLTLAKATPEWTPGAEAEPERKSLFQDFDPSSYRAGRLLDGPLLPLDWLLDKSLLAGTLGYFVGPPGAGKSQFLLQLCATMATGEAAFMGKLWRIERARPVLFICAEDDARILQRRLRQVLNKLRDLGLFSLSPARVEQLLRDNLYIVPASGEDLRLIRMDGANAGPSDTFHLLLDAAKRIEGLGLVVIDPLSRFYGANENDNSTATLFSSLLERIAKETGCTVICSHHTSKKAALVSGKFNIDAALDADAMRGASGLTGACRWQFNLTGLPVAFAKERLNLAGREGQFLAGKVSKKSYGPPEQAIYLERGKGGVLFPVQGTGRPQDVDAEAAILDWLRYRITRQGEEGLPGLTKRSAAECWKEVDAPGVTKTMFKEVTERAILDGELFLVMGKNTSGRRAEYLSLMPESDSEKTYQTGRKEAAEKRQLFEAAEAAEALPVLNVNDFNTLQSGSFSKRQKRQQDPECTQVPEITEAAEAAEAASLKREEEHPKVPPLSSIPAGETIPKEGGNIARLSSTETPKPPLRRQTSTAMTTPKATAKTPSKFTPARETDSVPF